MGLTKAKVKAVVFREFVGKLTDKGFTPRKDKLGAFRVRNEFVDVISIQIGRNAGSIYLHYFTNLLADPFFSLTSYYVGNRLGANQVEGVVWLAENEVQLVDLLCYVARAVDTAALPFFGDCSGLEQYGIALEKSEARMLLSLDLALFYALNNQSAKCLEICEKILYRITNEQASGCEVSEDDIALMENARKLGQAVRRNGFVDLVEQWKNENLEKLRLAELRKYHSE